MKVLVLVACLAAAAHARPDVSHLFGNDHGHDHHHDNSYHYQPPQTNYGVPSGPQSAYIPPSNPSVDIQTPYFPSQQGGYSSQQNSYSGQQSSYSGNEIVPNPPSQPSGLYNSPEIQHQRNVYFFASPEEPEESQQQLRVSYVPGPAVKSTNIIFVKAPVVRAPLPRIIVPQSQSQTRTVVYVLQRKPEQPAPVQIQLPQSQAAKPEVVFVRYNNDHDAHHEIQALTNGERTSGGDHVHVNDIGNQDGLLTLIRNQKSGPVQVLHDHDTSGTGTNGQVAYPDTSNGYQYSQNTQQGSLGLL